MKGLTILATLGVAIAIACAHPASLLRPADKHFAVAAPDSFDVEMVTTKGTVVVRTRRAWSPHGADRFYVLVKNNYFDSIAIHRTVRNFVVQFGLHGDPAVNEAWRTQTIPDDTVRAKNKRGTIAFARGGANTRNVQLFFNLIDNTPRLDTLNRFGFPPIGEIISGMAVLDSLSFEYPTVRGGPSPSQDSITKQGNAYLLRAFPKLDYILGARVVSAGKKK
jgi:peptidyl-prolyl cis-trans isomerase A (cyclophilin A)